AARSSDRRILLVACRSMASRASSGSIPSPSSSTRTCLLPPSSTWIATRRAPASMAFSTSSLTTDAGRSTTSPAAIWLARSGGRRVTRPPSEPVLAPEKHQHDADNDQHDAGDPPELHGIAAGKMRQRHVQAVHTAEQRQRPENRG